MAIWKCVHNWHCLAIGGGKEVAPPRQAAWFQHESDGVRRRLEEMNGMNHTDSALQR